MPVPMTTEALLQLCRQSGLIESIHFDQFLRTHVLPNEPLKAAAILVQNGLLTRYQAQQLLAGKYKGFLLGQIKILDQIGAGGMGTVFLGEQLLLRRLVALKILPPSQAQDPACRERFLQEARAVAALDHPNIVRIFDSNAHQDIHYLMMEYVDGLDLQVLLERQGPLPLREAVGYVFQAAQGLYHAHQRGVIHRDIKPSNLLIDRNGTIKIMDMGLAQFFEDHEQVSPARRGKQEVLGTVDFLSPEQATPDKPVDWRSDIYSLGVTLYCLLSGRAAFSGTPTERLQSLQTRAPIALHRIRPDVPRELAQIVDKMMAKRPEDRYQSAADVIEALRPWVPAAETLHTGKTSLKISSLSLFRASSRMTKLPRKRRFIWSILAALLLGTAIGVLVIPDRSEKEQTKTDVTATETKDRSSTSNALIVKDLPGVIVRMDLLGQKPFVAQTQGRSLELKEYAKNLDGWRFGAWDKDTKTEIILEQDEDGPRLGLRNLEGRHSAMLFTPEQKWKQGHRYELTLEYMTTGVGRGLIVFWDAVHLNRKVGELKPTGSRWKKTSLQVEMPFSGLTRFEFHVLQDGVENTLYLRNVEVRNLGDTTQFLTHPIQEVRFDSGKPFQISIDGKTTSKVGEGNLPPGWSALCWKSNSKAEISLEEVEGIAGLAIRNSKEGDPTVNLRAETLFEKTKPGQPYLVRLVYFAEKDCKGEIQLRYPNQKTHFSIIPIQSTNSFWKALDLLITPTAASQYQLYLTNRSKGANTTLYLRYVGLQEWNPPMDLSRQIKQVDFQTFSPFRAVVNHLEPIQIEEGSIPENWKAISEKSGSTGYVGVDSQTGQPALFLRNREGPAPVFFQTNMPICDVHAGRTYAVRVWFQAGASSGGAMHLRTDPRGADVERIPFPVTSHDWREVGLLYRPQQDGPLHLAFSNLGSNEDSWLFLRRLEIQDVTER